MKTQYIVFKVLLCCFLSQKRIYLNLEFYNISCNILQRISFETLFGRTECDLTVHLRSRAHNGICRCPSMQISTKHLTGSLVCFAPTLTKQKPVSFYYFTLFLCIFTCAFKIILIAFNLLLKLPLGVESLLFIKSSSSSFCAKKLTLIVNLLFKQIIF